MMTKSFICPNLNLKYYGFKNEPDFTLLQSPVCQLKTNEHVGQRCPPVSKIFFENTLRSVDIADMCHCSQLTLQTVDIADIHLMSGDPAGTTVN